MPSSDTNNFISAETAALLRLEELRAQTAEKQEKIEELKLQQQEITVLESCMKSNSNCWQDLQKNNTTALDKVVETTNYVVKANGEGLDKMICGNEKIHQTIKQQQRRRTLGGTKAVFIADDDDADKPSPKGDILPFDEVEFVDDGASAFSGLTSLDMKNDDEEESKADTFATAKSTAETTFHTTKSTESETEGDLMASLKATEFPSTEEPATKVKSMASLKDTEVPSTESETKGESKKLKKEKSVKFFEPENNSSLPFTTPKKMKKSVNEPPKTCPAPRRSARKNTQKSKDPAYVY